MFIGWAYLEKEIHKQNLISAGKTNVKVKLEPVISYKTISNQVKYNSTISLTITLYIKNK